MTYEEFKALANDASYFICSDQVPTELINFLFKICPNIPVLHYEMLKTLVVVRNFPFPYPYAYGRKDIAVLELETLYDYLVEYNLIEEDLL